MSIEFGSHSHFFFGELNSGLGDLFVNRLCKKPNTEQLRECDNNILYYNA